MSQTLAAPSASAVHRIVNQTADRRRAEDREKGHPVHRDAVDYLDLEARRPRRLSSTDYQDECDHHRAVLDVVEAWQARSVAEGPSRYRGIFGVHGVATCRLLIREMARSGDGRCDLAYSQVATEVGQARGTVYRRYHALIAAGVIDYQPRSIIAGSDGRGRGLRLQMSSVAWLTPHRMPDEWRRLYEHRLEHYRGQRQARARRRAAEERRQHAQSQLRQVCAEKAEQAREGGTPPRQRRAIRTFDPLKVNPAGMLRLVDAATERTLEATDEEQRDADRVRSMLPELTAAVAAQCG